MAVKPTVFVGAPSEREDIAQHVVQVLSPYADAIGWRLANFVPGQSTLESLVNAAEQFDFGLFIFGPHDKTQSRGQVKLSTRDNVIFEYGLFLGTQGLDRTFAIFEITEHSSQKLKVPSDLYGIGMPHFGGLTKTAVLSSLQAALGPVAEQIRKKGRWHRRYGLRKSWKFDRKAGVFRMRLSAAKIRQRMEKLGGNYLCIVAHKEDSLQNFEQLTALARSKPRPISTLSVDEDLILQTEASPVFEKVELTDRIWGHLLLIPAGAAIAGCNTIAAMLEMGCELLDSAGVSGTGRSETE